MRKQITRCKHTGKIIFPDKWSALQELVRIKNNTNREERHKYECDYCDGWHLTSWEPHN